MPRCSAVAASAGRGERGERGERGSQGDRARRTHGRTDARTQPGRARELERDARRDTAKQGRARETGEDSRETETQGDRQKDKNPKKYDRGKGRRVGEREPGAETQRDRQQGGAGGALAAPRAGGRGCVWGETQEEGGVPGGRDPGAELGGGAGGDEGDPGAGRLSAGVRAGLSGRRGRRWRPQAGGVGPAGPGRGRGARGDGGGAFTWPCARNLYSQHASTTWEPEGSRCAAESLGLILCTIKHSAASPSCSYTSSTLNKHNDDIRCNSR